MDSERQRTLDALRAQISQIVGAPEVQTGRLPSGQAELDAAIGGGWPRPGLVEITGRVGSGRLVPAQHSVASLSASGRPVALVDPLGRFYPPGWAGSVLERLLVVQPPPEQTGWVAEQLARSGAFPLTVLLEPPRLGRAGARLARAVEQGDSVVLVVSEQSDVKLPAALRLEAWGYQGARVELRVTRLRGGLAGRRLRLAPPA
ncbi:MAG: hypothetical protein H6741_29495 [Alphaproteobacteria bacterium]|nr:hypothetical protein [Alphaproteobacteria bacterium]